MNTFHIYGLGAALVDTEIEVSDHELERHGIEKGVMTLVDQDRQTHLLSAFSDHLTVSRRASGGSAANSIIAVSSFGGDAYYSCKVANDENGGFYLGDLASAGVAHNGRVTGKCLVLITPDAERTMNTFLGISETLCPLNLNIEAIAASEYLYIEGYLVTSPTGRQAAIEACAVARKNNTKIALSLSDPGIVAHFREGLLEIMGGRVDLLFCNRDEAFDWTNTGDTEAAATAMSDYAENFAITLGADGALVYDGEHLHRVESSPVKAIDTNGAGDMFAGAFLYGITHGFDYARAGAFANSAAAQVVSQFGPRLELDGYQAILTGFS
jgi:sugar/nucleoside kinase (ribokinase family)